MDNGMPQGSVVSINEPPGSHVMPTLEEKQMPKRAKGKELKKPKTKTRELKANKKRNRR